MNFDKSLTDGVLEGLSKARENLAKDDRNDDLNGLVNVNRGAVEQTALIGSNAEGVSKEVANRHDFLATKISQKIDQILKAEIIDENSLVALRNDMAEICEIQSNSKLSGSVKDLPSLDELKLYFETIKRRLNIRELLSHGDLRLSQPNQDTVELVVDGKVVAEFGDGRVEEFERNSADVIVSSRFLNFNDRFLDPVRISRSSNLTGDPIQNFRDMVFGYDADGTYTDKFRIFHLTVKTDGKGVVFSGDGFVNYRYTPKSTPLSE